MCVCGGGGGGDINIITEMDLTKGSMYVLIQV